MSSPQRPYEPIPNRPPVSTGEATPAPSSKGEPHPLSPVPSSPSAKAWVPEGLNPSGAEMLSKRSVAIQDLTSDKILLAAPRTDYEGRPVPALGGIPILAKLGQGGMGAVYYGVHPRLQKEVAVKVLPFLLAEQQPELVQRFYREARIAARVQSPHLVSVLDVNEENGLFFLVMEFVHGETGKKYLSRINELGKAGIEEIVALEICAAACKGLAAAHEGNIVHRDIKPDNILIPFSKDGDRLNFASAKVSDLGLARGEDVHQSLTGTQSAMGTPGYMSPEQAMDAHSAGVRADVFSMGATLYALLTGRAPFTGTSVTKVIFDTVQAPHPPITQFRPDLSPATLSVIERCLRKNPAERFANGGELHAALHACRDIMGEPEPTVRGTLPVPLGPPATSPIPTPVPAQTPATAFTPAPPPAAGSQRMSLPQTDLPAFTPVPVPSAPLPPVTSAPVPPKAGAGRVITAAAVLLVLAGGGYGAWFYLDQKALETRRSEIAAAISNARNKTADEKALGDGLALLDQTESKYKDAPDADLSALRTLKAGLKTMLAQKKLDREVAEAAAQGKDPGALDAALARLSALELQFKDERGADLTSLLDAKKGLTQRREVLDRRLRDFQGMLEHAGRLLKEDPAGALEELAKAEMLGKADASKGLPDLLAGLHPDLAERRTAAQTAKAALDKKLAAEAQLKLEQDQRTKFSRDLEHAQKAFYDQKNVVLAETALNDALRALGELDHQDKETAIALLESIRLEKQKQANFAGWLAKGNEAFEGKKYGEAKTAFQKALETWPDSPKKELLLTKLKEAGDASAKQSEEENLSEARKLLQQQKWTEAADAYSRVLDLHPRHVEATKGHSDAVYGGSIKAGNDALAQKHWTEAEQAFSQALKERAGDPVAKKGAAEARYGAAMQEGAEAAHLQSWPKSKAAYDRAAAEKPGDAEAQRGSQNAQRAMAQQQYADAVAEGRRALQAGNNTGAAAAFKRALELIPGGREAAEGFAAASGVKVTLDAKAAWKDSGVKVKPGDKVKIFAAGQWKSFHLGRMADASGKGGSPTGRIMNKDAENHEFFSETLIARIMGAAAEPPKRVGLLAAPPPAGPPPFYVGKDKDFTAESEGVLQFQMNEENAMLANPLYDNEGQLDITIQVIPASFAAGAVQRPEPATPAPVQAPAPAERPAPAEGAFGNYETLGTFGVYANKAGQGIPLDKNGKLIPIRTDLDKDQYDEATQDQKSVKSIEKGTRVRIETTGTWYSGPGGAWVGADGKHKDGKPALKQFRAFRGANDEYNIAMLVVFISDKEKNSTEDFNRIAQAGYVWATDNKDAPIEFIMPVTGTLRFQQNRDGFYDVTKGALSVTISISKLKK